MNKSNARCSLADMNHIAEALSMIPLNDGEKLDVFISEMDNSVAVNILKTGEDRLKGEIASLISSNRFPNECVTVFTIDPTDENPVT